jgi:integrase
MSTESLGSWALKYLDHAKIKFVKKTYLGKKKAFALFFQYPGVNRNLEVTRLKRELCLAFFNHTFVERGGHGVNNYIKDLKAAWNWGIDFIDLPELNPFTRIPKYAVNAQPRYVPPLVDFWKVYDKANGQDKNLLLAYFHTAGRRGDLFRLKWEDVDFSRRTVKLKSRKNKTATWVSRTIAMSDALYHALNEQFKNTSGEKFVFISDCTKDPWITREKIMRELCAKAQVRPFGFHSIRHLSASLMYDNRVAMTEIQRILGHTNLTTTEIYIRSLGTEENGASTLPDPENRTGKGLLIRPTDENEPI